MVILTWNMIIPCYSSTSVTLIDYRHKRWCTIDTPQHSLRLQQGKFVRKLGFNLSIPDARSFRKAPRRQGPPVAKRTHAGCPGSMKTRRQASIVDRCSRGRRWTSSSTPHRMGNRRVKTLGDTLPAQYCVRSGCVQLSDILMDPVARISPTSLRRASARKV
ncbi:hypothetical protein BDN71DRAFT_1453699 [Pleurotus eryngii]|uniref:Uncharacterized protein n=1 Tax=Pleurotus eryngii TaxID=5323 RepID=A0A9P5ZPS0_PLEER|nr:hypothetical protein BDN71DRAFT_1453699 [Pleurotus eryngii]